MMSLSHLGKCATNRSTVGSHLSEHVSYLTDGKAHALGMWYRQCLVLIPGMQVETARKEQKQSSRQKVVIPFRFHSNDDSSIFDYKQFLLECKILWFSKLYVLVVFQIVQLPERLWSPPIWINIFLLYLIWYLCVSTHPCMKLSCKSQISSMFLVPYFNSLKQADVNIATLLGELCDIQNMDKSLTREIILLQSFLSWPAMLLICHTLIN